MDAFLSSLSASLRVLPVTNTNNIQPIPLSLSPPSSEHPLVHQHQQILQQIQQLQDFRQPREGSGASVASPFTTPATTLGIEFLPKLQDAEHPVSSSVEAQLWQLNVESIPDVCKHFSLF